VRNDSIERSFNDTMLTIADSILQMIEQAKKQKELDRNRLADPDELSILNEERGEDEYELYYGLIKERRPDLFEVNGDYVESFPVDKDKSTFQIFHNNGEFYGVFKQLAKDAHIVTQVFHSKEEVLLNTFGTSEFEKYRGHTFFLSNDGKVFSLQKNKQLRLNLVKPFKTLAFYENIKEARSLVVMDELRKDPKLRIQALRRTLEAHFIPLVLLGKTVTLNSISKDNEGVWVSFEVNKKEQNIRLPDFDEKWMERVWDNSRMTAFDELIMNSRSIREGFLAFYGLEINNELQTRQHDFEVISNEAGSYIGKLSGNGRVKRLSPYYSEEEANKKLKNLHNHIQLHKQKERYEDKGADLSIQLDSSD
jgi:hypothetical protein